MSNTQPRDMLQRQQAIDPTRSFIVQAPAGSGKTELLTDRILALLARVSQPEQIVAITFTRKAAAEMHARVLEKLAKGQEPEPAQSGHALQSWRLARAALEQDQACQWHLLEHPARLTIRTIDAFCASIVRQLPWLSSLGGMPRICDDSMPYYIQAARQTMAMLDHPDVCTLLEHLDLNEQAACEGLAAMLARRDQWLPLLDRGQSRQALDESLQRFIEHDIQRILDQIPDTWQSSLQPIAIKAAQCLEQEGKAVNPLAPLLDWQSHWLKADIADLPRWRALAFLLLTDSGGVRKQLNKNHGFAPKSEHKEWFASWCDTFAAGDAVPWVQALHALRVTPSEHLSDVQYRVLSAQLGCLTLATAYLWTAFSQAGEVDFIEVAQRANQALGSADEPSDLLLKFDSHIQHILVDEFQDTSQSQLELLHKLTAGWQLGDGRTVFLVGDPMQSIYRFRKAEVRLFLNVRDHGLGDHIQMESLQLNTNFRSQSGLVQWVNDTFEACFVKQDQPVVGAISYAKSEPFLPQTWPYPVQWHLMEDEEHETQEVVRLAHEGWQKFKDSPNPVAILVRARKHIGQVMRLLRRHGLPCRAVEMVPLQERAVVVDLIQLALALVHEADRAAWVAVLRARWCGLTLQTLHGVLAGENLNKSVRSVMLADLAEPVKPDAVSLDQWQRWLSVAAVMCRAFEQVNMPFAMRLEQTWRSLEGHRTLDDPVQELDAQAVFQFLEKMAEHSSIDMDRAINGLSRLYAQPETSGRAIEVMTMHKAKGLQFEQVIVMGLHRQTKGDVAPLVRVDQIDEAIVFGPVKSKLDKEQDAIAHYLGSLEARRTQYEVDRLLYVAATRAQSTFHIVAQVSLDKQGEQLSPPIRSSLLARLWPFCPDQIKVDARNRLLEAKALREQDADSAESLSRKASFQWQGPAMYRRAQPLVVAGTQGLNSNAGGESFGLHPNKGVQVWSTELPTERSVGTVVHAWLAMAVEQNQGRLPKWDAASLHAQAPQIANQLGMVGLPLALRHKGAQEVIDILLAMLANERGRWLLTQPHARVEWALIDQTAKVSVLDWAILTSEGWLVVDYKTGRLQPDETMAQFTQRMMSRYQPQLERYCQYLTALDGRKSQSALYFPKDDIWLEGPVMASDL